ncbi:hypothetical protein GCM10023084_56440 [Streptomyces lacrimifluminis]|uniref:Bacterial Ig domain-containing protein n=1 Tax=Streptomyces lacrimifluminis TaxID=1500077 RepID=A0A917KL70_9ACTN|nr:hypothetical protein GCM10012282_11010 [Streptomyces lacrimifluminis]
MFQEGHLAGLLGSEELGSLSLRRTPEADSTSGAGMPVPVNFTEAVTDRAAVQRAITVTAEPAVEVVGHWFSDTRLDFRPETYWAVGTKITLGLRLKDVKGADGVYGTPVQGRHLPHRPRADQHGRPGGEDHDRTAGRCDHGHLSRLRRRCRAHHLVRDHGDQRAVQADSDGVLDGRTR